MQTDGHSDLLDANQTICATDETHSASSVIADDGILAQIAANTYSQPNDHTERETKLSRHFLGTLICKDVAKLFKGKDCSEIVRLAVEEYDAQITGVLLHEFPNSSFTLLVGLSESHISIHTWPECNTVQLDVFLCNYVHDNSLRCEAIYKRIVEYFDVTEDNTVIVERV